MSLVRLMFLTQGIAFDLLALSGIPKLQTIDSLIWLLIVFSRASGCLEMAAARNSEMPSLHPMLWYNVTTNRIRACALFLAVVDRLSARQLYFDIANVARTVDCLENQSPSYQRRGAGGNK